MPIDPCCYAADGLFVNVEKSVEPFLVLLLVEELERRPMYVGYGMRGTSNVLGGN